MTENEKDRELLRLCDEKDRLEEENRRLFEERRAADKAWREDMTTDIGEMKACVVETNGKMDSFIRKNAEQDKQISEHHVSLYGTPGRPNTGVIARQQSTEEKMTHAAKLYWLVVSLMVTTIGGAVIAAVIYLPKP